MINYFEQDSENDHIYHSELFTLTKRMVKGVPHKLSFTVPIFEPHPPQYYIHAISDSWLHSEAFYTITFHNLPLPEVLHILLFPFPFLEWQLGSHSMSLILRIYLHQARTSHTELLDLKPLPVSSLGNSAFENLYKFSHFNPIQTQVCFICFTEFFFFDYAPLFYIHNIWITWADFSCLVSHGQ